MSYFINRLPTGEEHRTKTLLGKSLSAYFAAKGNSEQGFLLGVSEALSRRQRNRDEVGSSAEDWRDDVGTRMGIPVSTVESIYLKLRGVELGRIASVTEWVGVVCDWYEERPMRLFEHQRSSHFSDSFSSAIGIAKKDFVLNDEMARICIELMRSNVGLWLAGANLVVLEKALTPRPTEFCIWARQFVLRLVPEFSYVVGLFAFVARRIAELDEVPEQVSLTLATGASCVREGVDDPRKLALREIARGTLSRLEVHESFRTIEHLCPPFVWNENYRTVKRSIAEVYASSGKA